MATSISRTRCITCGQDKATLKCSGCLGDFCFNHCIYHRQQLAKQADEIEVSRDVFRQTLTEQTNDLQRHPLAKQIDEWERDAIDKIKKTAVEAKRLLFKHTAKQIVQLEERLNKLTKELRESREENDIIETDLTRWNGELTMLTELLTKPSNIAIRHDSIPLVNKIQVNVPSGSSFIPDISFNTQWRQNGMTVAGGNGEGNALNQLNSPYGLCVDDHQTVYVTDFVNHRIMEWKSDAISGRIFAGEHAQENRADQLNCPADVLFDKDSDSLILSDYNNRRVMRWRLQNGTNGEILISDIGYCGLSMGNDRYLYVSDYDKHEVRRWKIGETNLEGEGEVVAGGSGPGNRPNQLNNPTHICVDENHSLYVSDKNNHRVMKWIKGAREGVVVAGGQGQGNGLNQLSYPCGVRIDKSESVYIVDYDNQRVMRWTKGSIQGTVVVGANGQGGQSDQLFRPYNLSFDRQGNLYVTDCGNHRIQKFLIKSSLNT